MRRTSGWSYKDHLDRVKRQKALLQYLRNETRLRVSSIIKSIINSEDDENFSTLGEPSNYYVAVFENGGREECLSITLTCERPFRSLDENRIAALFARLLSVPVSRINVWSSADYKITIEVCEPS